MYSYDVSKSKMSISASGSQKMIILCRFETMTLLMRLPVLPSDGFSQQMAFFMEGLKKVDFYLKKLFYKKSTAGRKQDRTFFKVKLYS